MLRAPTPNEFFNYSKVERMKLLIRQGYFDKPGERIVSKMLEQLKEKFIGVNYHAN